MLRYACFVVAFLTPVGIALPVTGNTESAAQASNNQKQADSDLPKPPRTPLYAKGGLRANAVRTTSVNNLKQIGLAFHSFHDVYNAFPINIMDKEGKPLLSWRVAILPYVEEEQLYKQFKLDEPWDSEHNKKLIAKMPRVYYPDKSDINGYTFYRSFVGKGAIMPPPGRGVRGTRLLGITDGSSNTMMVAEAAEPVIWTKPDDLPFDPKDEAPKLGGGIFADGFNALFADGSVHWLKTNIDAKTLKGLITTSGGEVVRIP